jgi:zinc protease
MGGSGFRFRISDSGLFGQVGRLAPLCLALLLLLSTAQLQLIVETNAQSPFVAIEVWIHTGTADETPENNGIAHFLEHMIFKGTAQHPRGELDAQIETSGGLLAANTERDWTRYYTTVPNSEWQKTLRILLEHLKSPAIPVDELEKERAVILRHEYARHESDPVRRLRYRLYAQAFEDNAYGLPMLGNPTVLEKLNREQILNFHKRHYLPSEFTIVLTGNLTLQEAQPIVQEVLTQIPAAQNNRTEKKLFKAKPATLVQEEKGENRVYIGYALTMPPAQKPEDVIATQLFLKLLTAPSEGFLYRKPEPGSEEQDEPLPFIHVYSEYLPRTQAGIITLIFEVKPGQTEALKSHVEITFKRIRNLKQTELNSATARLLNHYDYEAATPGGRAYQLSLYHTLGLPEMATHYAALSKKISLTRIQQIVDGYAPSTSPTSTSISSTPQTPPPFLPSPDVQRHRLANGMKILILPVPDSKTVSVQAFVQAGVSEEEEYPAGIGAVLMRILFGTTQNETPGTIRYRMGATGGNLNTSWEPQFTHVEMNVQPEKLESMLSLLAEGLFRADIERKAFQAARDATLDTLTDPREQPFRQAQTLARNALYGNQIYGQSFGGTPESITRLTLQDVKQFYQSYYTPNNFVLVIAGDVKPERALTLVRRFFEDFESEAKPSIPSPLSSAATKVGLKEEKSSLPMSGAGGASYLTAAASLPGVEAKQYATARILSAILGEGKGSRLFQSLREAEGIGYELGSMLIPLRGRTPLLCYVQCGAEDSPETLQKVQAFLNAELKSLIEQPPTESELNRAKQFVRSQYELEGLRLQEIAYRLGFWESLGVGYEQAVNLPVQIEAVTAQQVQEMAKECLSKIGMGVVTK